MMKKKIGPKSVFFEQKANNAFVGLQYTFNKVWGVYLLLAEFAGQALTLHDSFLGAGGKVVVSHICCRRTIA